MPLLKENRFVDDQWVRLHDDAPIPASGDVIVSFARLLSDYEKLSKIDGRLGVEFTNAERADVLETFLPGLSLVVLTFPKFADGRAYSQARHLRQLGFAGELRAVGDVLPDQLAFMIEVGFDAFEVTDRFGPGIWHKAAAQIRLGYQFTQRPARLNVWRARQSGNSPGIN